MFSSDSCKFCHFPDTVFHFRFILILPCLLHLLLTHLSLLILHVFIIYVVHALFCHLVFVEAYKLLVMTFPPYS
jgi:hypothetical protein